MEIELRLTRVSLDGLPEVNNRFSKLLALDVDLGQVKVNEGILGLEALSFGESCPSGVKLPRGQRLKASLEGSREALRSFGRHLPERKPQS